VHGKDAIRAAIESCAALKPRLSGEIARTVIAGDLALVLNKWSLEGTAPDGEPVRMAGLSADVMRKDGDGSWRIAIDDPWGGGGA
jgi:ketosteroid isomerase-like protein